MVASNGRFPLLGGGRVFSDDFTADRLERANRICLAYGGGGDVTKGHVERLAARHERWCALRGLRGPRYIRHLFRMAGWGPRNLEASFAEHKVNLRWFRALPRVEAYIIVREQHNFRFGTLSIRRLGLNAEKLSSNRRIELAAPRVKV